MELISLLSYHSLTKECIGIGIFFSQNVLGVCNFEMIFTYALTGWEGSAHYGKVLADAKLKGLPIRAGKYYLADAGYALSKLCPGRTKRI